MTEFNPARAARTWERFSHLALSASSGSVKITIHHWGSGSEKVSKVGEFGDYLPGYYCVNQWWLWRRMNLVEVSRGRRLSQELPNALIQCAVDQQVRAGAINPDH